MTLTGTGDANTTVLILDGKATVGTTMVSPGGAWGMTFVGSTSVRTLTAVASDAAGNMATGGSVLLGTNGPDMLASIGGSDLLYGGGGPDTFSFAAVFGHDIIADFAPSGTTHDKINFHGSPTLNTYLNLLGHTSQVGSGVVISADANDTLTLNNVTKSALVAADFSFI
jgi:Ca2+-binding RTX toxin-like protein